MSRNSAARLDRLVVLPQTQPGLHLAARASGRGDDALAVGAEQLAIHARLEVVALERGLRRHAEQVVHALRRLGEHRDVRVRAGAGDVVLAARAPLHAGLVGAVGARGEVGLGADDGLDARLGRGAPEVEGAEHVAVVGDRDGGHPLRGGLGDERLRRAPHRRASSTRCARGGGRRNRRERSTCSLRWMGSSSQSRSAPEGPPACRPSVSAERLRRPRARRARAADRPGTARRTAPARRCRDARNRAAWRAATAAPSPRRSLSRGSAPYIASPDARVPLRRHVHADLVRAPRLEVHLEQGRGGECLERVVVGHRGLAVGDHGEAPGRAGVPADRRVDRAREAGRDAPGRRAW